MTDSFPCEYQCSVNGCRWNGTHEDFSRTNYWKFIRHLKSHLGLKNVKCGFRSRCHLRFSSVEDLEKHSKEHRRSNINTSSRSVSITSLRSLRCIEPACGFRQFTGVSLFLNHLTSYHSKEFRKCPYLNCDRVLKPNERTKNHFYRAHQLKSHTNLKPEYLVEVYTRPAQESGWNWSCSRCWFE